MTQQQHRVDLIERHAITVPVPENSLPGDLLDHARQRTWAALQADARRWAEEHEMVIEAMPFETCDPDGRPKEWGVRWTVHVGAGGEPANKNSWIWSARQQYWREMFRLLDRGRFTCHDGGQVLPLRR